MKGYDRMKKKKVLLSLVLTFILLLTSTAYSQTPYNFRNYPAQIKITGSAVNVRSGPSTSFMKVGMVYKGQIIDCVGKIGSWFVVHLENDTVGCVSGSYAQPYYPPAPSTPKPTPKPTPTPAKTPTVTSTPGTGTITPTAMEQEMLNLVNQARKSAGLQPLSFDPELIKLARLKSQDMANKNYFSHTSPTYGSPFDMLKSFGISYKYAGENLAGNSSVQAAHESLMNSPGHRANILNANYNYIGIGIVKSSKYGYLFTQLFVGR